MHPLSQLPLLSVLVLTLRRSLPNFPCPAPSPRPPPLLSPRALSPRALCLWTPPPTFCISPTQLRHSQPLCVNSCTYRQRIPTGKGILLATFTLHNAAPIFVSFYSGSRLPAIVLSPRTIAVSALLASFFRYIASAVTRTCVSFQDDLTKGHLSYTVGIFGQRCDFVATALLSTKQSNF